MDEHHDDTVKLPKPGQEEKPAAVKTGDEGSGELDAVSVTLHFMLGKARINLGDMRTLAAGSIILFGGGSPEAVAIVSSGRSLGRGEVVDVDGRLGVRITQWGHEGE